MSKATIFRKRAGISLAIIGIILSILPAIRMTDGSKETIIQLLLNNEFMHREVVTAEYVTGITILCILIYGLFVHMINLICWLQKKEKTHIGIIALSVISFIAIVMIGGISTFFQDAMIATFPFTIWQVIRIPVVLFEAIIKSSGEEIYMVFIKK